MTVLANLWDKPFMLGILSGQSEQAGELNMQANHLPCLLHHTHITNTLIINVQTQLPDMMPEITSVCYFCWPKIFLHSGLLFLTLIHFWFWNQLTDQEFHKTLPSLNFAFVWNIPLICHELPLAINFHLADYELIYHTDMGSLRCSMSHNSCYSLFNYTPVIWANWVKWYSVTGLTVSPEDFSFCLSCSSSAVNSSQHLVWLLPDPWQWKSPAACAPVRVSSCLGHGYFFIRCCCSHLFHML